MKKIILLTSLCLSSIAFSQSKEQKVEKLVEAMQFDKSINAMMTQLIQGYSQKYPSVPKEFWTKFQKEMNPKEFQKKLTPVYLKYYTEEDLDGLISFYNSPIGKKSMEVMPFVMRDAMAIGEEWGQEISKKVIADLEKENYLSPPPPASSSKKK